MDGAVEGAVADVVALLSSSKRASWRLLILSPLALPRLALPRANRCVSLHQQSVWPTLAFWFKPSPEGLCLGSRECGRLRRPFNDFRRTGSRREHGLDGLDGLLDLLVAHRLDAPAVLELHLARHQKRKDLEVRGRLVTSDLLDRLLALMAEVQQQRLHELLVQQVTRAVPVAVGV